MVDSLEARQRWTSAGSGSSSSSPSYGNEQDVDGDDDNGGSSSSQSASDASAWPPLKFTYDLDHTQLACKDIKLTFTGGCKPYSLSAFWFTDGKQADPTWVELKEKTWDNSFQWNSECPLVSVA